MEIRKIRLIRVLILSPMKTFISLIFIGFFLLNCSKSSNQTTDSTQTIKELTETDKEQIKNLVKSAYKWYDANSSESDFEPIPNEADSIYVGIDLKKHQTRLENLKKSGFFAEEFLNNYNKIAETLDKKLKSKEFEWLVGELPRFGNDASPWCNCQDYISENPWDNIILNFTNSDASNAEFSWTWNNETAKTFTYKMKAQKVDNQWKISYLEGFNFENFTKKNY